MIFCRENSYFGSEIDVPVAEGYNDSTGAIRALIDSVTEETKLFEHMIGCDFKEAYAIYNPDMVTESEMEIIQEAAGSGIFSKIKEFFLKCWEKIKAIFKSFWDMIRAIFTRNNKELVSKFKKQVIGKDLSRMKYKMCKPTSSSKYADNAVEFCRLYDLGEDLIFAAGAANKKGFDTKSIEELSNKTKTDICEELCKDELGGINYDEFAKEFHEDLFEDEEEYEGLNSNELNKIIETLSNGDKSLKELKKIETGINKWYSKTTKMLDKQYKELKNIKDVDSYKKTTEYNDNYNVNKGTSKKDGSTDYEGYGKDVSKMNRYLYTYATAINDIQNKCISCLIDASKFAIKESRRTFIAAVRFNPKLVKESNEIMEHVCEASDIEFDMYTESYEF